MINLEEERKSLLICTNIEEYYNIRTKLLEKYGFFTENEQEIKIEYQYLKEKLFKMYDIINFNQDFLQALEFENKFKYISILKKIFNNKNWKEIIELEKNINKLFPNKLDIDYKNSREEKYDKIMYELLSMSRKWKNTENKKVIFNIFHKRITSILNTNIIVDFDIFNEAMEQKCSVQAINSNLRILFTLYFKMRDCINPKNIYKIEKIDDNLCITTEYIKN
jgi:hypothetical protein